MLPFQRTQVWFPIPVPCTCNSNFRAFYTLVYRGTYTHVYLPPYTHTHACTHAHTYTCTHIHIIKNKVIFFSRLILQRGLGRKSQAWMEGTA